MLAKPSINTDRRGHDSRDDCTSQAHPEKGASAARCEWTKMTSSEMDHAAALVDLARWKPAEAQHADLSRQLAADLEPGPAIFPEAVAAPGV